MVGELKPYKVQLNGQPTTLLLSDEDAKARGLKPKGAVRTAANKARTADHKS
jgi:hypothetical protein